MFAAALVRDPVVMQSFSDMVVRTTIRRGIEAAAFVVLNSDGTYECRLWPASQLVEKQVFVGEIPANVVAIVHTHPADSDPWPSKGDALEAQRLGIAIWVLTRFSIYAVDASGHVETIVRNTNWVVAARPRR